MRRDRLPYRGEVGAQQRLLTVVDAAGRLIGEQGASDPLKK